jgi:hypothetical protein
MKAHDAEQRLLLDQGQVGNIGHEKLPLFHLFVNMEEIHRISRHGGRKSFEPPKEQ